MKDYSPDLYDEYKKETLLSSFKKETKKQNTLLPDSTTKPEFTGLSTLKNTVRCDKLDPNHPALKYLYSRKFNTNEIRRLLYTDDFKSVASQINEESSKKLLDNEPRIIIPFYDTESKIKLIQGRALKESKMKYITIKQHDDVDKIYGEENIDPSKIKYVVEGPLDSLFVNNCIATCDANLIRSDADVLIFDNQPRNKEVVSLMQQAINEGRSLVIWPNSPDSKQDINDMIKSGISKELLMQVIKQCTFSGIVAQLKFNQWKKV
ncbi:MAG: hypothetical protein R3230_00925 [Nitrosopumilaceae archaeon]|nr:hypothetical protein [Nitrosopumilaceae archaeon]